MERVVLDPLEYRIDRPSLLARLRLKEGSGHATMVEGLIREAEAVAHPRAIYRMAFIESRGDQHVVAEGLRFESRVLKVNLYNLHRFLPLWSPRAANWMAGRMPGPISWNVSGRMQSIRPWSSPPARSWIGICRNVTAWRKRRA